MRDESNTTNQETTMALLRCQIEALKLVVTEREDDGEWCRWDDVQECITELEQRLASKEDALAAALLVVDEAQKEHARLNRRDGNASIILCSQTANDPFHQEKLKIIDFGVSDNVYTVEKENNDLKGICEICESVSVKKADQALVDSRQLAKALIKAHPPVQHINGFSWKMRPCDCPACQTARRVLSEPE